MNEFEQLICEKFDIFNLLNLHICYWDLNNLSYCGTIEIGTMQIIHLKDEEKVFQKM